MHLLFLPHPQNNRGHLQNTDLNAWPRHHAVDSEDALLEAVCRHAVGSVAIRDVSGTVMARFA